MAWDDHIGLEIAVMFQHLNVGWDEQCERLVFRRRWRWREENEARRRTCPTCSAPMHHAAKSCLVCAAKHRRPYKSCSSCRGPREHKDSARCLACSLGDRLTRMWMDRNDLELRLRKGLAIRRCPHGARKARADEAPVACLECILDVLCSPLPEERATSVVGAAVARKAAESAAPEPTGDMDIERARKRKAAGDYAGSWYLWPISLEPSCHCGGALREHPDGKRLVCREGHTKAR